MFTVRAGLEKWCALCRGPVFCFKKTSFGKLTTRSFAIKEASSIFVALLLFFCFCCLKNPSGPEEEPKNSREYTWTVDTLSYPGTLQTLMYDVWASSPRDVYVIGHMDGPYDMYHFDGNNWEPVPMSFGAIDLNDIYGFAADDIWAVGGKLTRNPNPPPDYFYVSLIIHYDGTGWREVALQKEQLLTSVWGISSEEMWAGGINGTLYHYDGTAWRPDSVPITIPEDADPLYSFTSITGKSSEEIYMDLFAPLPYWVSRNYFLRRQFGQWTVMDSVLYNPRSGLWMSP